MEIKLWKIVTKVFGKSLTTIFQSLNFPLGVRPLKISIQPSTNIRSDPKKQKSDKNNNEKEKGNREMTRDLNVSINEKNIIKNLFAVYTEFVEILSSSLFSPQDKAAKLLLLFNAVDSAFPPPKVVEEEQPPIFSSKLFSFSYVVFVVVSSAASLAKISIFS